MRAISRHFTLPKDPINPLPLLSCPDGLIAYSTFRHPSQEFKQICLAGHIQSSRRIALELHNS